MVEAFKVVATQFAKLQTDYDTANWKAAATLISLQQAAGVQPHIFHALTTKTTDTILAAAKDLVAVRRDYKDAARKLYAASASLREAAIAELSAMLKEGKELKAWYGCRGGTYELRQFCNVTTKSEGILKMTMMDREMSTLDEVHVASLDHLSLIPFMPCISERMQRAIIIALNEQPSTVEFRVRY